MKVYYFGKQKKLKKKETVINNHSRFSYQHAT